MDEDDFPLSATVYVRNCDELIKLHELLHVFYNTFSKIGKVVGINARKNERAKGQAFVVFESVEDADLAISMLQGMKVCGKTLLLEHAKTRSDATVMNEEGLGKLEKHKLRRMAEKERKIALEKANAQHTKRPAQDPLTERPAKAAKAANTKDAIPDEYVLPNKVLFLRDLPADYGSDEITMIFTRFPGFKEVRTVPGRKGIAFVEFEDEGGAITAKEKTAGMKLGENTLKVAFQRQ